MSSLQCFLLLRDQIEVTRSQSRTIGGLGKRLHIILSSKFSYEKACVALRIVTMKDPRRGDLRANSEGPFSQTIDDSFVKKNSVYRLSRWHKLLVDDSFGIKKTISKISTRHLLMRAFLGARRSTGVPLGTLPFGFRVVFRSHDSSPFITESKISGSTCSLPKFNAKRDVHSLLNFSLHRES